MLDSIGTDKDFILSLIGQTSNIVKIQAVSAKGRAGLVGIASDITSRGLDILDHKIERYIYCESCLDCPLAVLHALQVHLEENYSVDIPDVVKVALPNYTAESAENDPEENEPDTITITLA